MTLQDEAPAIAASRKQELVDQAVTHVWRHGVPVNATRRNQGPVAVRAEGVLVHPPQVYPELLPHDLPSQVQDLDIHPRFGHRRQGAPAGGSIGRPPIRAALLQHGAQGGRNRSGRRADEGSIGRGRCGPS